jgi:cholesterol transport system auxiliary component
MAAVASAALAACSLAPSVPAPTVYDLGPPPAGATAPARALPALSSVQVQTPLWLDTPGIAYRLEWRDAREVASYRDSRWAAPPAALLAERVRQRLARSAMASGAAQASAPGTARALRLEVEEFAHLFAAPERSRGLLRWRASLLDPTTGRVIAQRVFEQSADAARGDAAGGTRALTQAADAAIDALLEWLAGNR